ncbi:hypothetical protein GCM10022629_37180 [Amorphoplanes auranticolor]
MVGHRTDDAQHQQGNREGCDQAVFDAVQPTHDDLSPLNGGRDSAWALPGAESYSQDRQLLRITEVRAASTETSDFYPDEADQRSPVDTQGRGRL